MLRKSAMNSVPRVEVDHRARQARLQLERVERLLMPHLAARRSWLKWSIAILSHRIYGQASPRSRTPTSLSAQRPPVGGSLCFCE